MALASLADLKQWLGVVSNADDALLERLIDAAGGFIDRYLGRQVAETTHDETYDGNGGPTLALPLLPGQRVSEVLSLAILDRPIPPASGARAPGYRLHGDVVTLVGEVYPRGVRNVAIVYRAGYATPPPEIAQACIELAALRYRERERIGHASKSVGGETVSFVLDDMPAPTRTLLDGYRRVVL